MPNLSCIQTRLESSLPHDLAFKNKSYSSGVLTPRSVHFDQSVNEEAFHRNLTSALRASIAPPNSAQATGKRGEGLLPEDAAQDKVRTVRESSDEVADLEGEDGMQYVQAVFRHERE